MVLSRVMRERSMRNCCPQGRKLDGAPIFRFNSHQALTFSLQVRPVLDD